MKCLNCVKGRQIKYMNWGICRRRKTDEPDVSREGLENVPEENR